ncbi:MAG: right-handed parallel beta-helix repeat-containing protein [Terracidiphilus sp.]|nr:right-handed parallel beta-helix repeat-containing protein [Terracidiphilus sp.]
MRQIVIAVCLLALCRIAPAQTTHYLDCNRTAGAGDSLRPESAWNSVSQANTFIFQPGDKLLLRRGSQCNGMLEPKGSGSAQTAIILSAYGDGPLPVINGGKQKAGLQLLNQQYWDIQNLEIVGGSPYGLHIATDSSSIRHLHLRNLVVHNVQGEPTTKESGLLVVAPSANATGTIGDVFIDGVTAYDTTQWAGILVSGASYDQQNHRYGDGITIRNSIVHDVAGDGILLASARHGLIEHNVAWNTGMQETETIGTPNAIWEWMCVDCSVAWNEGFFSDSPGVDGGVFDIDYGNINNIVEHNFAHDSQGYCAAIFGADGSAGDSINSIVRDNTCLHNGRSPRLARRQGAIFVKTWHQGRLNGIEIARNTILWEPPLDAPAIHAIADFFGTLPNRIVDNRILLRAGSALQTSPSIETGANRICASPEKDFCTCWTEALHLAERTAHDAKPLPRQLSSFGHGWRLATTIPSNTAQNDSRSRVVLLESMMQQFGNLGLQGVLWPLKNLSQTEVERLRTDWHLSPRIAIALVAAHKPLSSDPIYLLAPDGTVTASWQATVDAAQIWLELELRLGTPAGMQSNRYCESRK